MKDLKINFVKFYQAVTPGPKSAQTSSKVIESRNVQEKDLVSIAKTNEMSVLITIEDVNGVKSYTEVPYNNLAYIKYDPVEPKVEAKTKK